MTGVNDLNCNGLQKMLTVMGMAVPVRSLDS